MSSKCTTVLLHNYTLQENRRGVDPFRRGGDPPQQWSNFQMLMQDTQGGRSTMEKAGGACDQKSFDERGVESVRAWLLLLWRREEVKSPASESCFAPKSLHLWTKPLLRWKHHST